MKSSQKHHSLIDKVYALKTLRQAYFKAARKRGSSGSDGVSWKEYGQNLAPNISHLSLLLRTRQYKPLPFKVINKCTYDGKTIVVHVPSIVDRIVEHAIRMVLEPIFESIFFDFVSGYRPGRSRINALRRAFELYSDNCPWLLNLQIERLAESISHAQLLSALNRYIADGQLLNLISQDLQNLKGLPCGSALTPFLCNVYLNQIDSILQTNSVVRFSSTYAMFFRTESEAVIGKSTLEDIVAGFSLYVDKASTGIVFQPHIENLFLYEGFFEKTPDMGRGIHG